MLFARLIHPIPIEHFARWFNNTSSRSSMASIFRRQPSIAPLTLLPISTPSSLQLLPHCGRRHSDLLPQHEKMIKKIGRLPP